MAGKSKGKQEQKSGSDYGGHAAYQKAAGPASSKEGADAKTPYKHR